jgi:hypothetical protein
MKQAGYQAVGALGLPIAWPICDRIPFFSQPDLTNEDYSDLAKLVREAIDAEPYRVRPRIKKLRGLLAKLDPASTERAVTPYPPPRPSAEPSLLYQKLRGGRRPALAR